MVKDFTTEGVRRWMKGEKDSVKRHGKSEHDRRENESPVHDVHHKKRRDPNIAKENIESASRIVLHLARDTWPVEL